jgi:hypothetical protein
MKSSSYYWIPAAWAIAIIILLVSGCSYLKGCDARPCTAPEILVRLAGANNPIPVYVPEAGSPYSNIILSFTYIDTGSETRLVTVFSSKDPASLIARINTSVFEGDLDGALNNSKEVHISSANDTIGITCDPTPGTYVNDAPSGTPYQTCLVWKSGRYWFRYYSILPLDESLVFVNSLTEMKQ